MKGRGKEVFSQCFFIFLFITHLTSLLRHHQHHEEEGKRDRSPKALLFFPTSFIFMFKRRYKSFPFSLFLSVSVQNNDASVLYPFPLLFCARIVNVLHLKCRSSRRVGGVTRKELDLEGKESGIRGKRTVNVDEGKKG